MSQITRAWTAESRRRFNSDAAPSCLAQMRIHTQGLRSEHTVAERDLPAFGRAVAYAMFIAERDGCSLVDCNAAVVEFDRVAKRTPRIHFGTFRQGYWTKPTDTVRVLATIEIPNWDAPMGNDAIVPIAEPALLAA